MPPDGPEPTAPVPTANPTPTPTRPGSATAGQQQQMPPAPSLGAVLGAVINSGRPARALIVILTGIMSAYLVVLMQSPTHPAPAVSSVPISFAGRALMDWTFVFSQEGSSKIGVAMVESESWREEWQTLASLLYLYELEITALASVEGLQSAASKELWKFRGITRLGGPVENFLKPVPGNRTLALLLRTPGNEELSYRVLQLKPEESTPPPALGFSVASYVVSGSCNAADLSPEKPTCVPSLPAPVTFNELPFPGSLVVMRAAQGPKGVFYSRERESEIFRYFPFDGKDAEMLPSPPTSNPLSRLRPLLMVPMPTDNGDLALLDVRYSLSDSHLTFEAVVYVASTSSPSGHILRPPDYQPKGVDPQWTTVKVITVGPLPIVRQGEALIRAQLSLPLNPEEEAVLEDPSNLHFLSKPRYAQTGSTVVFVFLNHFFTIHAMPNGTTGPRFRATQQPLPTMDFFLRPEYLAVHEGKWLVVIGENGELAVFKKADPEEGRSGLWDLQGSMDDMGNYVPPENYKQGSEQADPRKRALAELERRKLEAGWLVRSTSRRLPGEGETLGHVFLPAKVSDSPPKVLLITQTHAHLIDLERTSIPSYSTFFAEHQAMMFGMAAVVAFFTLAELGWIDARQIVPVLVFLGWGVLMWSVVS